MVANVSMALVDSLVIVPMVGPVTDANPMSISAPLILAKTMPSVSICSSTTSVSAPRAPMANDAKLHPNDASDHPVSMEDSAEILDQDSTALALKVTLVLAANMNLMLVPRTPVKTERLALTTVVQTTNVFAHQATQERTAKKTSTIACQALVLLLLLALI
jgi:hypothetical protein